MQSWPISTTYRTQEAVPSRQHGCLRPVHLETLGFLLVFAGLSVVLSSSLRASLLVCSVGHQRYHVQYGPLLWPPALTSASPPTPCPRQNFLELLIYSEHPATYLKHSRASQDSRDTAMTPAFSAPMCQASPISRTRAFFQLCRLAVFSPCAGDTFLSP